MYYKEFLNPKRFIAGLPNKISWQLLLILIIITTIGKIFTITQFGLDFVKQFFISIGNYPPETQITNEVLFKALIIIFFGGAIIYAIKIGVISYLFTLIIKLFRKKIKFF